MKSSLDIAREFEEVLGEYCEYFDYDLDSALIFSHRLSDEVKLEEIAALSETIKELEDEYDDL